MRIKGRGSECNQALKCPMGQRSTKTPRQPAVSSFILKHEYFLSEPFSEAMTKLPVASAHLACFFQHKAAAALPPGSIVDCSGLKGRSDQSDVRNWCDQTDVGDRQSFLTEIIGLKFPGQQNDRKVG